MLYRTLMGEMTKLKLRLYIKVKTEKLLLYCGSKKILFLRKGTLINKEVNKQMCAGYPQMVPKISIYMCRERKKRLI